jgi:hypothetical protein
MAELSDRLSFENSFNIFIDDGWLMVLNATFNNISVISWQSVLTEVP